MLNAVLFNDDFISLAYFPIFPHCRDAMGDEEEVTLDGQYYQFSKLFDHTRDGTTITLYRSDFWFRQANVLDDRNITMTDTGLCFFKFEKFELNYDEWLRFLTDLCETKGYDRDKVQLQLINCGIPGQYPVVVPDYRDFYETYKQTDKGVL